MGGLASNGYGDLSPGKYSMMAAQRLDPPLINYLITTLTGLLNVVLLNIILIVASNSLCNSRR